MRTAIIIASVLGFAGAAFAAEGPTMDQCKMGWKSSYSKMWTKSQFKAACKSMMKSGM
jgi:hypothetical protein